MSNHRTVTADEVVGPDNGSPESQTPTSSSPPPSGGHPAGTDPLARIGDEVLNPPGDRMMALQLRVCSRGGTVTVDVDEEGFVSVQYDVLNPPGRPGPRPTRRTPPKTAY